MVRVKQSARKKHPKCSTNDLEDKKRNAPESSEDNLQGLKKFKDDMSLDKNENTVHRHQYIVFETADKSKKVISVTDEKYPDI